jgi:hypothetical protein
MTTAAGLEIDLDVELQGLNPALDKLAELLEQISDDPDAQDGLTEYVATSCGVWEALDRPDLAAILRQLVVVMLNVVNAEASDG